MVFDGYWRMGKHLPFTYMYVYTEGMIPCLSLPKQLIQTKIEFFQVINHNTLFPEKARLNIFFLSNFFFTAFIFK